MKRLLTPSAWRVRENQLFLALTVVIGIIAGLGAVLFALSIEAARHFLIGTDAPWWRVALAPCLASAVSGILLSRFFPDARGSGIPQTKVAFHAQDGVMHPRVALGKFLTAVPVIVIYMLGQKFMVAGLTAGSVKG